MAQTVFFLSLGLIGYAYAGYLLVLWVLTRVLAMPTSYEQTPELPKVSIMISVYNEEAVLSDKLTNSLLLDYPHELLEIIVVSDGSTDGTEGIARSFADRGVILKSYQGRIGKTACLNQVVADVSSDIVIFSDANSMYPPNTVRALIAPFSDPGIGFVTGGTSYVADSNGRMGESIGIYARLEQMTKLLESRLGSCVGADGAMFAVRRSLFQPLDHADINDLVIPLRIVRAGYRGIYSPQASCVEVVAKEAAKEFSRQVRIAVRTIRAVLAERALLNPFVYGLFAFQLASHKLCKLMVPFLLLSAFMANVVLVGTSPFYLGLLIIQLMIYITAWMAVRPSAVPASDSFAMRLLDLMHSFLVVNAAVGIAWAHYWKGNSFTTWAPAR
ncbi:MAG: glycosyltransferase family 2 protein [Nitrospira sp. LK265]|nr:glycosyltransferase family 2 protein [Nitrospira sp.]NGZ59375.1 glycosyltransferase family 2 protein [Nitrospira sp. LK265]